MRPQCAGGGGTKMLSVDEQMRAWTRCERCSKVLKLRRNQSGFAAKEAFLPPHKELDARDRGRA